MARRARVTPGGLIYHALNRSVAGLPLFRKQKDFEAFERIMIEAHARHPIRVLAWRGVLRIGAGAAFGQNGTATKRCGRFLLLGRYRDPAIGCVG